MMSQIERDMQLRDILERTGYNPEVHAEVDYDINAYLSSRWSRLKHGNGTTSREGRRIMSNTINALQIWICIAVVVVVSEAIKLYVDSQCGLISMTCPTSMLFPSSFYIIFIVSGIAINAFFFGRWYCKR